MEALLARKTRYMVAWLRSLLSTAQRSEKGTNHLVYHSNFDSEMFEKWFTNLCTTLTRSIQAWLVKHGTVAVCVIIIITISNSHLFDVISGIKYEVKHAIAQLLVRVQPHHLRHSSHRYILRPFAALPSRGSAYWNVVGADDKPHRGESRFKCSRTGR